MAGAPVVRRQDVPSLPPLGSTEPLAAKPTAKVPDNPGAFAAPPRRFVAAKVAGSCITTATAGSLAAQTGTTCALVRNRAVSDRRLRRPAGELRTCLIATNRSADVAASHLDA